MRNAPPNPGRAASAELLGRLQERRAEIEAAIRARIEADGAPTEATDPEYGAGLRSAVPTALDYCLAAIARGSSSPPPFPLALLVQARLAARNDIRLDTVLRRYFAGYTILGDIAIEEAEHAGLLKGRDLKRLLRSLAQSFDRLIEAVAEEHTRERKCVGLKGTEQRRTEQVQRLLAGEPANAPDLAYDLDGQHLGLIAKGNGALEMLRVLAKSVDCRLLVLSREEETVWAWFGGRKKVDLEQLLSLASDILPCHTRLAIGEPGESLPGWRLTHRQAKAALPIALYSAERFVPYREVALLASALQDELLLNSLREMYLEPLEGERDGGQALRETLRAYLDTGWNVSSAAAALGISRQAVNGRLRIAEETLSRPLLTCAGEIDVALRVSEFAEATPAHATGLSRSAGVG